MWSITAILRAIVPPLLVLSGLGCQHPSAGSTGIGPGESEQERELTSILTGLEIDKGLVIVRAPIRRGEAAGTMSRGEVLLQRNQFKEAAREFAHAVRSDQRDPRPLVRLGFALHAEGYPAIAEACYRTAVNIAPTDVEARQLFAWQLAARQAFDEAIREMTESLSLTDDQATLGIAHERIAIWSYYLGDDAGAWEHTAAAEQLGHTLPPQFLALLERRSPRDR